MEKPRRSTLAMDSGKAMHLLLIWMSFMAMLVSSRGAKCAFEAIFTFGDSNSDTGGFFAAFPSQPLPNGMTFFKKPTGRQTDGRLYIDFLAQALGLPFLSPYLKAIGSDFRHGANFATSASTVLLPDTSLFVTGVSPFSLAIQLNQMKQFKARVDEESSGQTYLPPKDIFGKSLYTIYIGQNDFTGKLASLGIAGVQKFLPQLVSQICSTVKELYWLGGRTFLVLNLGPMGCYPGYLLRLPHGSSDIDQYGCLISLNNAVSDYNKMLKAALEKTRQDLPDAQLVYVNSYDVLLKLFQHPNSHGLQYATKACCGYGGGAYNFSPNVFCGYSNSIHGKRIDATACSDPEKHVIWDGYHVTEAANKILADAILNGSYSDPPFSFHKYCGVQLTS